MAKLDYSKFEDEDKKIGPKIPHSHHLHVKECLFKKSKAPPPLYIHVQVTMVYILLSLCWIDPLRTQRPALSMDNSIWWPFFSHVPNLIGFESPYEWARPSKGLRASYIVALANYVLAFKCKAFYLQ